MNTLTPNLNKGMKKYNVYNKHRVGTLSDLIQVLEKEKSQKRQQK